MCDGIIHALVCMIRAYQPQCSGTSICAHVDVMVCVECAFAVHVHAWM